MVLAAFLIEVVMDRICGLCQSPPGPSFTDKQAQYLAFIDAYTRVHGHPPAETDMQRHFQVSPPSVYQMVLTLERRGVIRRQPRVARSIEVLLAPEHLPVRRHSQPAKSSGSRI
jgi:SOS-response transcriptional repressor LexA